MTDIPIKIQFVKSLSTAQPSRIVAVKADGDTNFSLWVTDKTGIPYPIKETSGGTITAIQNTDGNLVITGTATKTINVAPALLALINSALQSGDNISELTNDANYITLADIPTFVPSDYDLEDFTNTSLDPFIRQSDVIAGGANLAYTPSPTNGIVTSDSGSDATLPLADTTNAGLLSPADKTKLNSTSNVNSGDQNLQSVLEKGNTTTEPFYNEFDAGSGNYVRSGVIPILGAPFPIVGQSTNNSGQLTEMAIAPHANGGFIVRKTGIVNKKINFLLPDKTNILYPSPNSYTLATLDDIPTPIDISGKVPYTGATTDVDLGEYQVKAGQIELDQTPTGTFSTAKIRWNDTAGTAEIRLKGGNVTLQVGQELVKRVVNKTATNINLQEANYQVVRIIGATGQRLSVDLAQADSETNSASTLGLVTEDIANNQEGFITFSGEINLINTTGSLQGETWIDGDVLYLSPTVAGGITNVAPTAPDHTVRIGYVQYAHITQGKIHVDVDRGYSLENLHNVKITATTAGKILGSTIEGLWENKTIPDALGYTPENVANKQNSLAVDGTGTKYATVDAIASNTVTTPETTELTWNNKLMFNCGDSTTWQMQGAGYGFDKMTNYHRLAGNQMESITGYVNFGASGYTLSSFVNDALATPPTINTTSNLGIGNWDYYGHNIQIPISQKTAIAYRKSLPTQEAIWVLSFGINDLILYSDNGNLTEAQIITYLTGLLNTAISTFKLECPKDKVILRMPNTMTARPYNAGAGFPSPTEYPTFGVDKPTDVALVTKWNTAIRKAYLKASQENLNTILFDTHKKVFELELSAEIDANLRPNMGDLVHPNEAGYISIANELAYIFKDTRVNKQETANLEAEKRAILLTNNAWENNAEYLFKKEKFNLVLSNNDFIVGGASNFLDLPYTLTDFNNATKGLPIYVKSGNVAYKITSYSAVASALNTRLLGISIPAKLYNSKAELSIFMDAFDRNNFVDISTAQTVSGIKTLSSPIFTGTPTAPTAAPGTNTTQIATMAALYATTTTELAYALSDETSNLTVGTLITFRMPFAMTLSEVRISLNDAPTLSSVVVDVKENGVSIFSTLLSIDANEKTSVTAATPAVISDVNLADDAEITISTTQIGSGDTGKGLKILFKGRKA